MGVAHGWGVSLLRPHECVLENAKRPRLHHLPGLADDEDGVFWGVSDTDIGRLANASGGSSPAGLSIARRFHGRFGSW